MNCRAIHVKSLIGLVVTAALVQSLHAGDAKPPQATDQAWTWAEAERQWRQHPGDVYLQYVVLQLAPSKKEKDRVARMIESKLPRRRRGRGVGREMDLFAMFSGALGVQESLQLDTMRPDGRPDSLAIPSPELMTHNLTDLTGPTVQSHPWGKMLAAQSIAGIKPAVSPLALCVPEDQYFLLFRSVDKLLNIVDSGDLWGEHFIAQTTETARTQLTTQRVMTQLAIHTDALSRPFYDSVVAEVAITGNDVYFREGSDVTLLFQVKQPKLFQVRMDSFLNEAMASRSDATRTSGTLDGVPYTHVATPDRAIHVYSAYPRTDLHVRSTSRIAFERVLKTIAKDAAHPSLGESTEFKYIRTLMRRGDAHEDGFVYLSDPFIRRLVGPQVKLTERRRLLCYNHLRMIGHASMLYRTQFGRPAPSLQSLVQSKCAPATFGEEQLKCPCGGHYSLSSDGSVGECSVHGRATQLTPSVEIPIEKITESEASQYKQFVEDYSRYWRRFFDPIAIRVQVTPREYRAETIILPLIDNSVYDNLVAALGGEPEPLDALPVPKSNIFTMAFRFNKEALLKNSGPFHFFLGLGQGSSVKQPDADKTNRFLISGIGNQVALNICDSQPLFDFNFTGCLGELVGTSNWGSGSLDDYVIPLSFFIAALNAPVYISIPVQDERIVDDYLEDVDAVLATTAQQPRRSGWLGYYQDFYRQPSSVLDGGIRCHVARFGPFKWRFYFARIKNGLYIASQPSILDDIARGVNEKGKDAGAPAHALLRIRANQWNRVLPAFQRGWAETNRYGCLGNHSPIASVARAMRSGSKQVPAMADVLSRADQLYAVHFFCPDGGQYEISPDARSVRCSVHGSTLEPRQDVAPATNSPVDQLMKSFTDLKAELTFLDDGLHAVVTIKRASQDRNQ